MEKERWHGSITIVETRMGFRDRSKTFMLAGFQNGITVMKTNILTCERHPEDCTSLLLGSDSIGVLNVGLSKRRRMLPRIRKRW